MRYRSTTHLLRRTGLSALLALVFALGTGAARAQLPLFDNADWLLDRGNVTFTVNTSGIPLRPGSNNINNVLNNPGHGVRRWTFPRTFDETGTTSVSPTIVLDNVNAADPQNFSDTAGHIVRTSAPYAMQSGLNPQLMAHTYLNGAWTLPLVPADGSANDYRAPNRGFSFTSDTTQTYSYDYAFVLATHNDFLVTDPTGQTRAATAGELATLPYSPSYVYAGVQNALVNDAHPTATYSSGAYNLLVGTYGVDIYSPGDGTNIGGVAHPNVTRALVRVSWSNTVDANGNIVKANTENPTTSRIYLVDLGQAGWIHLQGAGNAPAVFPYDGNPSDQITITIYSITPDTYSGPNDPVFGAAPLVTSDAVRFVGKTTNITSPALGPIAASGRILGPAIGTHNLLHTAGGATIADVQPLVYFAREESVPDPTPRIPLDPTKPVSASNPLIPDPTAVITAPVFYCVDSEAGNTVGGDGDGFLPSIGRVRWRYVGLADTDGSGTSAASPAIANVRCRDGVTRTIVYFLTTDSSAALGHIYAFDAAGNRPTLTTQNYWIYPSYRPLTPAEVAANQLPPQAHDPNYKGFVQAPYPAPVFPDIADPFFHYDGEIVKNPANAGEYIVRSDTQLPAFGGMQGSPVIMDDPSNPGGGQILVIGNINGHVYAFDAGGRGDFNPADLTSTGTTQRIWTWPHFGADAYYARNLAGTNRIADEPGVGAILGSLAYDPNYSSVDVTKRPLFVPGGDGRLYAINTPEDVVPAYNASTGVATWVDRRNWVYPALDLSGGLGGALSTPAIFQPAGANFPYLYFTCAGRAYAMQEIPAVISGTPPTLNSLKWVFPPTPNPPFSDPNNADLTAPLDPDFSGTAPVLMSQAALNAAGAFVGSPFVSNDFCYLLEGNSTLIGLNAFNGAFLASGTTQTGATTSSSPIATQLLGLPNDVGTLPSVSNTQPTIVFADDAGAIFGLSARPDTTQTGPPVGISQAYSGALMGQIWHHYEVNQSRIAASSLVNGLILEGDEGGQMRAYGVGTGLNGLGETVPGEPAEVQLGAGYLSIDLRVVDIYKKSDYTKMMANPPTATALHQTGGGNFGKSVNPAPGNINNTNAYASDWGDSLYVVAAGVYHAQPSDNPTNPMHGIPGTLRIHVTFTITQNGSVSTQEADLTPVVHPIHGAPGELWPDDLGVSPGENDTLSIFGIDPNSGNPAAQLLTGRNQNVYTWSYKVAIPIYPGATSTNGQVATYLPGSTNTTVTAHAEIYQDIATYDPTTMVSTDTGVQSAGTPTYRVGQSDYAGLNGQFQPPFYNYATLGTPRTYAVTNPIAVTTRGITSTDMTGSNNRNVVGLYPGINAPFSTQPIAKPLNVGELLGNGNQELIPGVTSAASVSKALFAPLPMVPDGATSTYMAVDNFGNPQNGFYIVDRSNYFGMRGRNLLVQVLTHKLGWHGWQPSANPSVTGSSVMNPLPWEQLPTDGQDSIDYPSIPTSAYSITKSTGEDAVAGLVPLTQPNYVNKLPDGSIDYDARQVVGTQFNLQVKVPKYQPANVNYGIHTFGGATFGSTFMDLGDDNRGNSSAASAYDRHILGPLITNTGDQAALGSAPAYPAAGYVSDMIVRTVPAGVALPNNGYNPLAFFNAARGLGNSAVTQAYRALSLGISVPPGIKMRIAESTLDVGKVPMGMGYTPLTNQNDARSFQVPFAPDMSPGLPGPFYWDNPNLGGQFFLPFTLYNESNVNLVDVRVAKMLGQNFSQINGKSLSQYTDPTVGVENTATAVSGALTSDQVNSQSISPLFMAAFKNVLGAPGVGIAGVVSSLDHISSSSNPVVSLYAERPLWPIANPFVAAADIASANQNFGAMLPTANNLAAGIVGWVDGQQPQPTVGKPRVGDMTGRTATIPDQPYSGNANFQRPKIGVAIPLGTPVGTYSAPVYAYEDNTPIQWQEWLSHYSKPAGVSQNYPVSHDGILNISQTGSPAEPKTDPTPTVVVTVREAKLSRAVTSGDLPMLDPFGSWNDPLHPELTTPPGADNFPAAYIAPGPGANVFNRNMFMYWPTNRRLSPDNRIDETPRPGYPNGSGLPKALAPFTMAVSSVPAPYSAVSGTNIVLGDFDFAPNNPFHLALSGNGSPLSPWWNLPSFTQYDNNSVYNLFPAAPSGTTPFLPGVANVDTMRLLHPAIASSIDFSGGYGVPNPNDPEAYLFWQGQVDKVIQANSGNFQTRDSRISWVRLFGGNTPGVPTGPFYATPTDPAQTKLAPRPLLVKLPAANGAPAQKFLYVFYHAGNQGNASIYYNAMVNTNLATPFDNTQWLTDINKNPVGDTKLPTPGALVWQSDPAPIYRHIPDPYGSGQTLDVIDVVFTGVLKGRQTVETLLSRYKINRTAPVNPGDPPIGALILLPVRKVVGEVMTRVGNTNTFQARDAAWELGTGPLGTVNPAVDTAGQISIYDVPGGGAVIGAQLINPQPAPNQTQAQLGTYDQASGLLYFNSSLGGQIVVDMRSGTVRFPQVAPALADRIQISYIPFVMRLNTSRDDSNIDRTLLANFGNLAGNPALQPTAAITSSGNNTSPIAIFDRGLNPRAQLSAPQVVFPTGATPTLDRMWVLYRKNDPSGVAKSTIYYKSMRLMIKLPFPVLLGPPAADGSQQMVPPIVTGNNGPYEVDWVRGRIYFTEADENSQIGVTYAYYDPISGKQNESGKLVYRVAWGDEISASIQRGDQTTPEVPLPTDSAVSEGQVSAFKDPFLDKLWVFWSSTRAGSTDLYYETIAPQFYPTGSNQR